MANYADDLKACVNNADLTDWDSLSSFYYCFFGALPHSDNFFDPTQIDDQDEALLQIDAAIALLEDFRTDDLQESDLFSYTTAGIYIDLLNEFKGMF